MHTMGHAFTRSHIASHCTALTHEPTNRSNACMQHSAPSHTCATLMGFMDPTHARARCMRTHKHTQVPVAVTEGCEGGITCRTGLRRIQAALGSRRPLAAAESEQLSQKKTSTHLCSRHVVCSYSPCNHLLRLSFAHLLFVAMFKRRGRPAISLMFEGR